MRYDRERLLALLPQVERIRDTESGGALSALLGVLAAQADRVDDSVAQLYDDWFIETCAEWVVPYIGDLLGVRGLNRVGGAAFSRRAWVAHTLGYRRRKGTASMLRQLAQDTTGYPAATVEYFAHTAWTQHVNHPRPSAVRTYDLRAADRLELLGGAFDPVPHVVDVRSIALGRGRHNVPNVGLFLWRLRAFPLEGVAARPAGAAPDGRFLFSPLGLDAPLFTPGREIAVVTDPAREPDMPGPLRRRVLFDELEAIRRHRLLGDPLPDLRAFGLQPVVRIRVKGEAAAIPPEEIFVANLEAWGKVPTSRAYPDATGATQTQAIRVAIDPVAGRLRFSGNEAPAAVDVDAAYGFGSAMGGGPYDRGRSVPTLLPPTVTWRRVVSTEARPGEPDVVPSVAQAIADWNATGAGHDGVIAVADSQTYGGDLDVAIAAGSHLAIVAADWPATPRADAPAELEHRPERLSPTGVRPLVVGRLTVTGGAPDGGAGGDAAAPVSILTVSGVLVEGRVTVAAGHLGRLTLADVTLVPAAGGLAVEASDADGSNSRLVVALERSITGPVSAPAPFAALSIVDSIVDGDLAAPTTPATIDRSTIGGTTSVRELEASDTIFRGVVDVERTQAGCVRFSYVPPGSGGVPRRHRCQPDQAVTDHPDQPADVVRARATPGFRSVRYGDPAYFGLVDHVAREIAQGASNGDEMGAFNRDLHAQRLANLLSAFDEYLRVGLAAGVSMST